MDTPDDPAPQAGGIGPAHLAGLALVLMLLLYARLLPVGGLDLWRALAPRSADGLDAPASGWMGREFYAGAFGWGAARSGKSFAGRMAGGAEAIRALHGLLAVSLGLLALAAYSRRAGGMGLGALGLLLLFPVLPLLLGGAQPGTLGLLGFLALLALLARPETGWPALVAAPLLVLWANLDPSFVLGLLLLAAVAIGRCKASLLAALALSVAAVLLATPDGPDLPGKLLAWASSPALGSQPFWQMPDFSQPSPVTWLLLASLVALALAQALSPKGFTPGEMLVLLVFAVLSLAKLGAVGYWFLLFPWLVLPRLAAGMASWPGLAPHRAYALVAGLLALQVAALSVPWAWLLRGEAQPAALSLAPSTPWAVAQQLLGGPEASPRLGKALRDSYPEERFAGGVFATGEEADFLAWALPEGWPVMCWGDPALATPERWERFEAVRAVRPDWWERLDEGGVNLAVLDPRRDAALIEAFAGDKEWESLPMQGFTLAIRQRPAPGSANAPR